MSTKRRKKSENGHESESTSFVGLDRQVSSNVFNDWNTEIATMTERHQEELSSKVSHLYEGVGRDLEMNVFDYSQNEDEYYISLLKSSSIEDSIRTILGCVESYNHSLNSEKRRREEAVLLESLKKGLLKSYSKMKSHKYVKNDEFIIKNWTYFLPILLSSSISDIEISPILDKLPDVVKFLVNSIRRFQFLTGKCDSIETIDTINTYRSILSDFNQVYEMYHDINNVSIERNTMDVQDPFTLYIKRAFDLIDKTKLSSSFIPFRFGKDHVELSPAARGRFRLEKSLRAEDVLYMVHGNNIASLGVFGSNYLKRVMNLDHLWQLSLFRSKSVGLQLNNHRGRSGKHEDFEIEHLDSFIGSLGYGYSSFDSLKSMNPRPELNRRDSSNLLRLQISKKVNSKYNKEMNPGAKNKPSLALNPLIHKYMDSIAASEDIQRFGSKDFSKFPSVPNREPERPELVLSAGANLDTDRVPLGFISTARQHKQGKRELELVVLDIKECSNHIMNQKNTSTVKSLRFEEYGLFWKTNPGKDGLYHFHMVPLRSCSASIHHSIKFKSHLYYSRFLLEQLINSNWKKRIITKNKKYYKLSSLVNGGFLSKSQKEAVNKISKIIISNGLWDNFSDIMPKLLTGTDKKIADNDLAEWEDFDENDEFDKEMSKLSSEARCGSSSRSSKFYGKYLRLSSKNYRLVSKRCQKMLAKYIFKEYPRFLTQYFKIRKEWKEFNRSEIQKRNRQNVNNSSRLQLEIIGHSGVKNIKAQFSNFESLNIKHESGDLKASDTQDPQVLHLIKLEKKESQNVFSVLPKFDPALPLNKVYRLESFLNTELLNSIKLEWSRSTSNALSGQLNRFPRTLLSNLNNSSVLNTRLKSSLVKLIIYINWLIYILNNSNKSFGGSRAIIKCLQASSDPQSSTKGSKNQETTRIPNEFCNWIIDNFMSKYQTENLQTRFSFSRTGESKLFATVLWLSNFVNAHSHNTNYLDYSDEKLDFPEFLPSSEPSPIDFSDLLLQDLKDKFTKKFRSLAHGMGFRTTTPVKRFKSINYMIPPNITNVVLSELPRL
ncbi:hypothetical protein OJ252_2029 [Cryptosporidium canis]|uniref:Uncharacterized protein n=1 Tax=Cryptosporidium canis TaxID=195482 RepID=A0ABQ8P6D4_9CRYT|nr:hypothetical protein OJ252_2029 [Cryptosporidium canis]